MKTIISALFLLGLLAVAMAAPTAPNTLRAADTCNEDRLTTLAGCGCFVQATMPHSPVQEIQVCQELFGTNLISLKPFCTNFMHGDDVSENAVSGAIAVVKTKCLSNILPPVVSRKVAKGLSLENVSERILPYLVAAALLLYAPAAH